MREKKNLILFIIGKGISIFGSKVYIFAVSLYVLKATGSALSFATTLICSVLPMLIISPIAGVIADKVNRKQMIIAMDTINGIVLILFYRFVMTGGTNVFAVYASVFIITLFTSIFDVCMEASKPNLVKKNHIIRINSISKIIDSVAELLGPVLGGIIFALVDFKLFIIVNGISFLCSALCECFLVFENKALEIQNEEGSFIQNLRGGVVYIKRHSDIQKIILIFILLNICNSLAVTVPIPIIMVNVLKLQNANVGLIQAMIALGMLIGAVFISKLLGRVSYKKLVVRTLLTIATVMLGISLPIIPYIIQMGELSYVIYYSLLMLTFGICITCVEIPTHTLVQEIVPPEYLGRVMSIIMMSVKVLVPICFLVTGIMMSYLETYILPIMGGLVLFISTYIIKKLLDNDSKTQLRFIMQKEECLKEETSLL